jgi:hypothetical protein
MIEDVLAQLAEGGFLVSNTFQTPEGPTCFGREPWKVFLRNSRNTRTGMGLGGTMEEALRAALDAAMKGPTYHQTLNAALTDKSSQLSPPRFPSRQVILQDLNGASAPGEAPGEAPEDLF